MTDDRKQQPKEGDATTGLTPVQIGAVLGLAAVAWMVADWLRWVT